MTQSKKSLRIFHYCSIFALALAVYLPLLSSHCRYFSQEDDAHHFNRTIEMAQKRDLNPHYFNKPALHFYLRLPAVYAAVAVEKLRGGIGSIKEMRTRDPYGLAGFAFTPSHPRILAWVRSISAIWSCLIALLAFFISIQLRQPPWSAWLAAIVVILSPEVLTNSYIVGVDTLMGLGCLITSAYALMTLQRYSRRHLYVCGLLAGLSCAAKYNAAPICIVPLMLWWLCDRSKEGLAGALLTPLLGFLVGAPYSLLSFDRFLSGVSYEIWHYAVAGHEGHSSERGIAQILFYFRWLLGDGVGIAGTALTALGAYALYTKNRRAFSILVSFPATYACLMILQKTHFTRNMLVLVPYCAICIAYALASLFSKVKGSSVALATAALAGIACLTPLATRSYEIVNGARHATDSRDNVAEWLKQERPPESDVAIAGSLQFPIQLFSLPGVDAFDSTRPSIAELIQSGFEFFVVPADLPLDTELCEMVRSVPGEQGLQRVPHNPAISILGVRSGGFLRAAERHPVTTELKLEESRLIPVCAPHSGESHCWISSHVTQVVIPHLTVPASFEVMSPWANQRVTVTDSDQDLIASLRLKVPGAWETLPIPPQRSVSNKPLVLTITQIHSPSSLGINTDQRRLGLALRAIQ